jgi:hypothetical protein
VLYGDGGGVAVCLVQSIKMEIKVVATIRCNCHI